MNNSFKKLYRSQENKIIAGICGGLGEYFNVDPVLIRTIYLILCFFHPEIILAYLCLILIISNKKI